MHPRSASRPHRTFFGILLLSLVACGGGAASTQAPGGATAKPQSTAGPAPTGAPTQASGGGQTADGCALATKAEVSAAYDFEVASVTPSSAENYRYCEYASADKEQKATTWILLSPDQAKSVMGTMKVNKGEPVPGVGDDAWWSTDSFQPGIYFRKGDRLAFASGSVFGPEEKVVALAKTMASRM